MASSLSEDSVQGKEAFCDMTLSPNKRIVLNTVATYSRSIISLAFGLFTARWVLLALGQSDFGLYGVVGALLSFLTFILSVLSSSVQRFYAYAIGRGKNLSHEEGMRELSEWFNTAFSIHALFAILILVVGLTAGEWAVRHILVIPPDRLSASVWVFRISVISACVSLITVPYGSLYTAYQYIAILTVFDLIRIVGMFFGAYWLLTASGDRLILYAILMMFFSSVVLIVQIIFAYRKFSFARIVPARLFEMGRIKSIGSFAGCKLLGVVGWLFKQQGSAVIINLNFGARANAAYSIAIQFAAHTSAVAVSLMTALTPALTSITGEGQTDKVRDYAMKSCRFAGLLVLILAVPLMSEIDYVLALWLKDPPQFAGGFCVFVALCTFFESITTGHLIALSAHGVIGAWQTFECVTLAATCPAAIICYRCGAGVLSIGYVFLASVLLINIGRVYFSYKFLDFSVRYWICKVSLPLLFIFMVGMALGKSTGFMMKPSFVRFCLTGLISAVTVIVLGWLLIIESSERVYLYGRLSRIRIWDITMCRQNKM